MRFLVGGHGSGHIAHAMRNIGDDKGMRDSRNDTNHKPSDEELDRPLVHGPTKTFIAVRNDREQTEKAVPHPGQPDATSIECKIQGTSSDRK